MQFFETPLAGVYLVELEKIRDDRGYFARSWCREEFEAHGLNPAMVQMNTGFSYRKGTLRGLHYQEPPYAEAKLVRCTRGVLYDVVVDLRPDSPTFCHWFGIDLTDEDGTMVYAPEGCAHGYQTLTDNTELSYLTSQIYRRDSARGVRYDDPAFNIRWPMKVAVISEADQTWPDFTMAPNRKHSEVSR